MPLLARLRLGTIRRFFAPTAVLFVAMALGSCSSVSAFVSDHWPTWAGGEPNDVPPRPGAPGYAEFISHQEAKDAAAAASAAAAGPTPMSAPARAAAPLATAASPQPIPSGDGRANDQAALQGGLY